MDIDMLKRLAAIDNIKGVKYTTYRIIPQTDGIVVPDKPKPVIVSFD